MDFRSSKTTALTVLLNILIFTCTSSCNTTCSPPTANVTYSPPSSNLTYSPTSSSVTQSPPSTKANCQTDIMRFGVCGMPSPQCCALLNGMTELQAAECLCTALKANVFGLVKVKVKVPLIYLLNGCGQTLPQGFKC